MCSVLFLLGGCFRERCLAVCHVLIFTSTFRCVWSHKDRHFMKLIKWRLWIWYIVYIFGCYKINNLGVVVFLSLSLFVVFFYEDLATLTLYHTAHESSEPRAKLRLLSLLFSCISHTDEYTDARSNTSLTTSCSVRFRTHCVEFLKMRLSLPVIFGELMWLWNAVVTPVF